MAYTTYIDSLIVKDSVILKEQEDVARLGRGLALGLGSDVDVGLHVGGNVQVRVTVTTRGLGWTELHLWSKPF